MRQAVSVSRAAIAEALTKPGALLLEMSVMVANDVVWVLFWMVFSHNAGPVRGWDAERLILLFAVVVCVFGLSNGLFANARHLSRIIDEGELDAALTLPMHPLLYLLCRRVSAFALGDFVFGILIFAFVAGHSVGSWLTLMAVVALGAVVLTSFLVVISAVSLWFGGGARSTQMGFDIAATFSMYPFDYFGGALKFVLLTAVPVAFIGAVPANVIHDFSLAQLLGLTAAATIAAGLAFVSFNTALRRYQSGSQWTAP